MDLSEKFISIAENEQRAADANAQLEQILYGTDTGGKSYYDLFWDEFQRNGERTQYTMAFAYTMNNNCISPKYDLTVGDGSYMFYSNLTTGLDLREEQFKENYGVNIDLSKATNLYQFIAYSRVRYVGTVNATLLKHGASTGLYYTFAYAPNLIKINRIIMPTDGAVIGTNYAFNKCDMLQEVYFDGYISTSIDFQWSPLIKASLENIVEHLSPTVTGQTVTFKRSAVESAFGIDLNDTSTYTEEFREWRQSRYNWTYSYV